MSAAGASNYTLFQVTKPNRGVVVRTEGKILGFDYFESVYSPMVSANLMIEEKYRKFTPTQIKKLLIDNSLKNLVKDEILIWEDIV